MLSRRTPVLVSHPGVQDCGLVGSGGTTGLIIIVVASCVCVVELSSDRRTAWMRFLLFFRVYLPIVFPFATFDVRICLYIRICIGEKSVASAI